MRGERRVPERVRAAVRGQEERARGPSRARESPRLVSESSAPPRALCTATRVPRRARNRASRRSRRRVGGTAPVAPRRGFVLLRRRRIHRSSPRSPSSARRSASATTRASSAATAATCSRFATTPSAARGPQTCTSTRFSKKGAVVGGALLVVARGPDDDDAARARAAHRRDARVRHVPLVHAPRGRRVRKRAVVVKRRARTHRDGGRVGVQNASRKMFRRLLRPSVLVVDIEQVLLHELRPSLRARHRELDVRDGQLLFRTHVAQAPHRQRLPAEALRAVGAHAWFIAAALGKTPTPYGRDSRRRTARGS